MIDLRRVGVCGALLADAREAGANGTGRVGDGCPGKRRTRDFAEEVQRRRRGRA